MEFTYRIPDRFRNEIQIGHRVLVPLGSRLMNGFVVQFLPSSDVADVRDITDILDPEPMLTREMVELTRWTGRYYMAAWGEVVRAALPPGSIRQNRCMITKRPDPDADKTALHDAEQAILELLPDSGKVSLHYLRKRLGGEGLRYRLGRLEKKRMIDIEQVLSGPRIQTVKELWVRIERTPDRSAVQDMQRKAPRQAEAVQCLLEKGGDLPRSGISVALGVLRRLQEQGIVRFYEKTRDRDPYGDLHPEKPDPVRPTSHQTAALKSIVAALNQGEFHPFLLYGVTASGKTQVYLEAIRHALDMGKTALVLIPEIALTPQAVYRYRSVFGEAVAVLHSRLSPGERYDAWRKIKCGRVSIALGPRSTVFAPLDRLGLIVVDEEHETSYKQADPSPRYHARDVAVYRARLNRCVVVLGSATPSLESFTNCDQGKYSLCELPHRIDRIPMPVVRLVSRGTDQGPASETILSPLLLERLARCLDQGEQAILLQNRRGYANFLRCAECGHIEECDHCDITLTFHQRGRLLKCHYCGFEKPAPDACARCGGATLAFRGVGTQRVEEALKSHFKDARVLRMDLDTTRRKGAHDAIVTAFERGDGDILLGTQMVAKGHDFPGVTLVGIISADTGLYFPDFRAGERTFQLITQAAGRAGRRDRQGEVIVQTMVPDHPVLIFAMKHDYSAFYRETMRQRQELGYPPWGRLMVVRFSGPSVQAVSAAAARFAGLARMPSWMDMLGPVAAPLSRIKAMYRYHITFRSPKDHDPAGQNLRRVVREILLRYQHAHMNPRVRIVLDMDPVDML